MVVEFRISLFKLFQNLGPISDKRLVCCLGTSKWPDPEHVLPHILQQYSKYGFM